jgi:tetratricopeptide (TPR) repeat protein
LSTTRVVEKPARDKERAMREMLTQHSGLAWGLLVAVLVLLLAFLLLLLRRRRQDATTSRAAGTEPSRRRSAEPATKLDGAALAAAVSDAETRGEKGRLPGLYLSLAQCRLETGATADAAELLRKCIRGAAGAELKETHAKARLALGDLAHASGDLTTACEHWQIARALFHELKHRHEHEAAESRMLRNGCPTDWVLTDF